MCNELNTRSHGFGGQYPPQKHSLKLDLGVRSLPFLSRYETCIFKLSANVLPWFSYQINDLGLRGLALGKYRPKT